MLNYQVNVSRKLQYTSEVTTTTGTKPASWRQNLVFTSTGTYTDDGNEEINYLKTTGHDVSSSGYDRTISYPLNVTSIYATFADGFSIMASLSRGKDVTTFGPSVFPKGLESFGISDASPTGSYLTTEQDGQATYVANNTAGTAISYGQTTQGLQFSAVSPRNTGLKRELYYRDVSAVNGTVVSDTIRDKGEPAVVMYGAPAKHNDMYGYARPKSNLVNAPPA